MRLLALGGVFMFFLGFGIKPKIYHQYTKKTQNTPETPATGGGSNVRSLFVPLIPGIDYKTETQHDEHKTSRWVSK